MELNQNHITTDDLAFSAYLRMKDYQLTSSHRSNKKSTFTFDLAGSRADSIKVEFINSEFLSYYNELRNLKKLL